jgi:hypothetical protein
MIFSLARANEHVKAHVADGSGVRVCTVRGDRFLPRHFSCRIFPAEAVGRRDGV